MELPGKLHLEAGRIKSCPGSDDFLRRPAEAVLKISGNDIAGIRNRNDDSVKPGSSDTGNQILAGAYRFFKEIKPCLPGESPFTCSIDQNIGILHVLHRAVIDIDVMGKITDGIPYIHGFSGRFFLFDVIKNDFISDSPDSQQQGCMGSYMAGSHNSDFSGLDHYNVKAFSKCS